MAETEDKYVCGRSLQLHIALHRLHTDNSNQEKKKKKGRTYYRKQFYAFFFFFFFNAHRNGSSGQDHSKTRRQPESPHQPRLGSLGELHSI